jgi:hypothetical protein
VPSLALDRIAAATYRTLTTLGGYEVDGDVLIWRGERPGDGWHAHGWTEAHPKMRVEGRITRVTLLKRRWSRADRRETTHSRPPDDFGLAYDAVIFAVELLCWLDAAVGLHRYETPYLDGPSRRTVQRWLRRALPRAEAFQSAVRFALIERSEPRPWETLFPNGLPPPGALLRRRWRDPTLVASLWRALSMLFDGADKLGLCATTLLAEARGRHDPQARSLV